MDIEELRTIEVEGGQALVPGQAIRLYGADGVRLRIKRAVFWQDGFVETQDTEPPPTFEDYLSAANDMAETDEARATTGRQNMDFLGSLTLGSIGGEFIIGPSKGFFPLVNFEGVVPLDHPWSTYYARRELSVRDWAEAAANVRGEAAEPPRHWQILQADPQGSITRMDVHTGRPRSFRELHAPVILSPGMAIGAVNYSTMAALSFVMRKSMADRGDVYISQPPKADVNIADLPVRPVDTITTSDHIVWSWQRLPAWAAQRPAQELWQLVEPHWSQVTRLL